MDNLSIYNTIRLGNGESYIILYFFDKRWYNEVNGFVDGCSGHNAGIFSGCFQTRSKQKDIEV